MSSVENIKMSVEKQGWSYRMLSDRHTAPNTHRTISHGHARPWRFITSPPCHPTHTKCLPSGIPQRSGCTITLTGKSWKLISDETAKHICKQTLVNLSSAVSDPSALTYTWKTNTREPDNSRKSKFLFKKETFSDIAFLCISLSFTHTLSPAVSYWLCISVRFPRLLLQWGINRHNWRNENLIIKDNSFVHIYTSAASTSCQVVSFILKSFPTLLVLLTGYKFSFPPSTSVAFYQQTSLYRSLPSGNDLSGPWEKKREGVEDRIPRSEEGSNPHQHVHQHLNPSFSSFHSLFSSAFTSSLSFSLKLMNGWKESKV